MGVITMIKCDKCGKEFVMGAKDEQPVAIRVIIQFGSTSVQTSYGNTFKEVLWCRECVMKEGITPPITAADKAVALREPPALEDIVVDLLRDLGFKHEADEN